jgi:hypothetical protein
LESRIQNRIRMFWKVGSGLGSGQNSSGSATLVRRVVLNDAGDLWNGLARMEEVDDGLALLHVARQPDVVELSGFFCLETDNVYIADYIADYIAVYSFYCLYCPFAVIKHRVQLYFPHTVLACS